MPHKAINQIIWIEQKLFEKIAYTYLSQGFREKPQGPKWGGRRKLRGKWLLRYQALLDPTKGQALSQARNWGYLSFLQLIAEAGVWA